MQQFHVNTQLEILAPTDAGTPGDIVYDSTPTQGKYLGWVYTTDKDSKRFSNISLEKEQKRLSL